MRTRWGPGVRTCESSASRAEPGLPALGERVHQTPCLTPAIAAGRPEVLPVGLLLVMRYAPCVADADHFLVTCILQERPMPALPSSNPAQFVQGAPVLHVEDVKATAAFYRDVLGFTWDFGDEAYAVVWRDNSAIHFVRDEGNPRGVHLFQWVKDVDAYHREIVGRGAEIARAPTDQSYGIRELGVLDINGVGIVFGQDIDHS